MATYNENINVKVDDKGSAKVVKRDIESIGGAAGKTQSAVGLLSKALVTLGAGLTIQTSVRTLADFSQEMSTVKAITGATDDQFSALRETAKELGATTRFSATQAAEGMSFLARAGFDTNQVLASVDDTLRLAQAGALDLGSAADIASNVLTGFRISADDAGRVVDVLAKAANSSNTNVAQLGDAMKYVAPVAAGMGVSLEEATAAAGALSDAGLQASMAGTGLRRVLSELESPSNNTQKILAKLGLTADDVRITQVGLTQALKNLAGAGVDTGLALEVFGDRGGPAFEVLSSSIPKVERLTQSFTSLEGYAEGVAAVMDDNLNGALLAVRSALEALVIAFGDLGAENYLTNFLRGLADAIRWVAANAESAAQAVAFLIAAMSASKIVAFTKSLGGASAALKALTAAIAANPVGLLLTAITAVTAGLILFQDEIKLSSDSVATLGDLMSVTWDAAKEAFAVFIQFFKDNFGFIADLASDAFGDINLSVKGVITFGARAVDTYLGFWTGMYRALIALWETFPDAFVAIFQRAFNAVSAVVEDNVNDIIGLLNLINRALDLEEIADVQIGGFADVSKAGMKDVGIAMVDAFKSGFDVNYAEGAVNQLFDKAEARARERIQSLAQSESGPAGTPEQRPTVSDAIASSAGTSDDGGFQQYLADLEREKELLGLTTQAREIQAEVLALEKDLKRELTEAERELVESSLEELQALERQSNLLDEIRGPQQEYNLNVEALNELLAEGKISLEEYNDKLQELDFEKAGKEAGKFNDFFKGAFDEAGDALSEFVKTGKVNFNDLVVSILEDLQQLAFEMAASELFGSAAGGGGGGGAGGLAGLFGGGGGFSGAGAFGAGSAIGSLLGSWIRGYADGGRPPVGRPSLVGERGPEIFVPDSSGVIVPNNEINVQGHTVNNIIQNRLNPGDVFEEGTKTPRGRKAFINMMTENPRESKQALGLG